MGHEGPKLLILETSGRVGQVAVARGPTVLEVRRLDEGRRHARDLAPAVRGVLATQGWRPRDLDAVAVSRGPGSYTGLRVGVMSAKALAYAAGCAVVGVETFTALARQTPAATPLIDVVADAQQDKVYWQRFQRRPDGGVETLTWLAVVAAADWLSGRGDDAWATGPGLRAKAVRSAAPARVVAEEWWDPQPKSLVQLALARLAAGEADDVWSLEPLYLRPSSAEAKWEALGK